MKVLLIGNNGFIGSHLDKALSNDSRFELVRCDVSKDTVDNYIQYEDSTNFWKNVFSQNFDFCINAAGAANVSASVENPENDRRLNYQLVKDILDGIRDCNSPASFINFSSAAVYGNPESLPVLESSIPRPISPYGKHKLEAEELCQTYDVNSINLRVFSAYGPGLKKQLFWDLNSKSELVDNVELFGDGTESRDFIYIDDLVKCVMLLLNKGIEGHSVMNVASGTEITIEHAASLFLELKGFSGKYSFNGEIRKGDPRHWRADISKLQSLGFDPTVSFREGLNNYVQWLQNLKIQ